MAKPPAKKRFASPRAEFLSAAFMSFWMNNIGVELALVKSFLEHRMGFTDVDPQRLFLALLFLHLCFFFGPAYAKRSRGALNNPAVYFLFYLLGDADAATARRGALSAVLGTILGTFAYAQTLKAVPLTGFRGIVPAVAAGGAKKGVAAEALVAFGNFLFAGVAPGVVGKDLAPYAGAFFYVITVVLEGCKYSCGFMNPAVVLATHVAGGARSRVSSLRKTPPRTSPRTPQAPRWARSPRRRRSASPTGPGPGKERARARTPRGARGEGERRPSPLRKSGTPNPPRRASPRASPRGSAGPVGGATDGHSVTDIQKKSSRAP